MKNTLCAALIATLSIVLTFGAAAQADDHNTDNGFGQADAATFGVETVNASNDYCAADAGTLGHPDPVTVCK